MLNYCLKALNIAKLEGGKVRKHLLNTARHI